jgi:hypothetical protein
VIRQEFFLPKKSDALLRHSMPHSPTPQIQIFYCSACGFIASDSTKGGACKQCKYSLLNEETLWSDDKKKCRYYSFRQGALFQYWVPARDALIEDVLLERILKDRLEVLLSEQNSLISKLCLSCSEDVKCCLLEEHAALTVQIQNTRSDLIFDFLCFDTVK